MNQSLVVVVSEVHEFLFKVIGVPKYEVVKVFTASRSDLSLDKRMR